MLAIDKKLSDQKCKLAIQNWLANSLLFPLMTDIVQSHTAATVEISRGAGTEQLCKPYHTPPNRHSAIAPDHGQSLTQHTTAVVILHSQSLQSEPVTAACSYHSHS